ncbi:MAG: flagellar biosynthetic protein FliR [Candidatus Lindowbacteria bacterium]|nr:flagellar biosynthetic protein FliR [Candidatus Lindowbacteria bacterium]
MDPVQFLEAHTIPFIHIFVRVTGIFILTPVLSVQEIPLQVKGTFSTVVTLVLYPVTSPYIQVQELISVQLLLSLLDDLLIGILIGLFVSVYQTAFLMAAGFYSIPMGFGIVNAMDPTTQSQVPILGQLKSMLGITIFILIDGHHMIIEALIYSFQKLPYLTANVLSSPDPVSASFGNLSGFMVQAMQEMFTISFALAAPILGTIFLVELVLGIFSKVAPQMNIMIVGFQVKIVVGIVVLIMTLPVIAQMSKTIYGKAFDLLFQVLGSI